MSGNRLGRPKHRPSHQAKEIFGTMADAGASDYVRARDLPPLVALWPKELADMGVDATRVIVEKLRRALRAERRRGIAGHWSYDLNRHLALWSAYKAELSHLAEARRPKGSAPVAPARASEHA